ncbi:type I-E CRISPR-associated protein Cas7/Cse4/CasC [Zhihengliuella somnathii]
MSLYLDIHALQTLPPSNINRDDTGAPKSATFGGVLRHRVSSQAWKRAIRSDFKNHLAPSQLGTRTRRVVAKIVAEVQEIAPTWDPQDAAKAAEQILGAAGIKTTPVKKKADTDEEKSEAFGESSYLLFLSAQQIRRVAEYLVENDGAKPSKKEAKSLLDEEHSVDISLFGRMIADAPDYNVDAAVQVAHALGVSAAEPEFDYFTAVDDSVQDAEETGAGMIGTVQMSSSTLYRYATLDVDGLARNLASGEAATSAAGAFLRSFIESMPTGKQNTFAARTLPDAVVVSLRDDRPVSLVNAFERPVTEENGSSRRVVAARRLAAEAKNLQEVYDAPAVRTWVLGLEELAAELTGLGDVVSLNTLLDGVTAELKTRENA